MTTQFGDHTVRRGMSQSPWTVSTCDRSYVIAALRAAAIALVLLGALALLILI